MVASLLTVMSLSLQRCILKDPDSLKIYNTYKGYDIDGYPSVVFDYGARNGFGGMNREYISVSYKNDLKTMIYGTYESMPYLYQ